MKGYMINKKAQNAIKKLKLVSNGKPTLAKDLDPIMINLILDKDAVEVIPELPGFEKSVETFRAKGYTMLTVPEDEDEVKLLVLAMKEKGMKLQF